MSEDYDSRVKAIRAYNQPILKAFRAWLERTGISAKTVKNQVEDIAFFGEYLVYYDNPLKRLDEADEGDVYSFLSDWFPRKALWSSPSSVKAYLTSFRKFFNWLGETGRVSEQVVRDVVDTLKEERETFLQAAEY
jgi:site-specific recombinase XerD